MTECYKVVVIFLDKKERKTAWILGDKRVADFIYEQRYVLLKQDAFILGRLERQQIEWE